MIIPAVLRKKYGIKSGSNVILHEESDGIKLIRTVTSEEIYANIGLLKGN